MKHKVIRIDNLMYNGCEPHWKCTRCGKCVPFHCYTKEQFENQECIIKDNNKCIKVENSNSFYARCDCCGTEWNIDILYYNDFNLCPKCGTKCIKKLKE